MRIQCPSTAAKIIAHKGRINIGWVSARAEVVKARPLTCYRCMERGHTAKNCTSDRDRSRRCYTGGGEGHRAKECTASSKCPVCSDAGKPANHRFGGKACDTSATRRTRRTREPDVTAQDQAAANQTSEECGHEEAIETAE